MLKTLLSLSLLSLSGAALAQDTFLDVDPFSDQPLPLNAIEGLQDLLILEELEEETREARRARLNLCEGVEIVNPGFGFGEQDFTIGCTDQIILENKGLDASAYEVTAVSFDPPLPKARAHLKALDKLTGRLTDLELTIGDSALFETLEVSLAACYKNPETETPESAAFLQVADTLTGREEVFSGWMYASSPSLSAMEHAIYDVWVVDCLD